jgi:hypothetical protein
MDKPDGLFPRDCPAGLSKALSLLIGFSSMREIGNQPGGYMGGGYRGGLRKETGVQLQKGRSRSWSGRARKKARKK